MSVIVFLFLFVIIFVPQTTYSENDKLESLVLVHAIFRHGDRTGDRSSCYPKDPYKNETYYPFGVGQLTNEGKRREYNLGRFLRQRYDKFLGEVYLPGLIDARSTDFDRTKMSLQLVLAGLFPPKGNQYWLYPLHWQPVPYNYEQIQRDKLLMGVVACPNYVKYLLENENSEQVQKVFRQHYDTLDYIARNTGCASSNLISASLLYFTLKTEDEWGFVLPNWTARVYPQPLQQIVSDWYLIGSETNKMKQITSGYLLQKILRDTQMKIESDTSTKIFLYSGHENNIAFLLNTLGVFQPHVPPYASCVLIEVHNIDGQYAVKVIYENYKNIQTGTLTIPGCDEICTLEKFVSFVQKYLPDDTICGTTDFSKPIFTTLLDTIANL